MHSSMKIDLGPLSRRKSGPFSLDPLNTAQLLVNAEIGKVGTGTASFNFSQSALRLCPHPCEGERVFLPGSLLGPLDK